MSPDVRGQKNGLKKNVRVRTRTHSGILLSHQKGPNLAFCNDMDGTRGYYTKQNKSVRERQIPCDFTHMWNLKNKTGEHRGKKERGKP